MNTILTTREKLRKRMLLFSLVGAFILSTAPAFTQNINEQDSILPVVQTDMLSAPHEQEVLKTDSIPPAGKTITGRVLDEKGEPIIGANILEIGTKNNGTVTDIDGNFSFVVSDDAGIHISYLGYVEQEVKTAGKTNLNIIMREESEELEEVVVIGYGSMRKVDLTGSIASMDAAKFKNQPLNRIQEAFQGRIAGVQVNNSGIPGGSMRIRIRGANSVNKSNDPLYIVDGMVSVGGISHINPDNIQSIQVLKDASSTAIYGSRGSNGVVLVSTKTGKDNGKLISFESQWGISSVYKRYELLNPYEFATAYKEIINPGAFTDQEMKEFKSGKVGVDWQDQIFRTALTQSYNLSYSAGNKETQHYLAANYQKQEGVVMKTSNERYQLKANIASEMTKWLHLTADLNASHQQYRGNGFAIGTNVIFSALNMAPVAPITDKDGNYPKDTYNFIGINPVGLLELNGNNSMNNTIAGHADLRVSILRGLSFTTSNGFDYLDQKSYSFGSKKLEGSRNNAMRNSDLYRLMLQSSNNLTYDLNINDAHKLTATAVYELSKYQQRNMGIVGEDLTTEDKGWWNLDVAKKRDGSNAFSQYSMMSFLGRFMYNYKDRYLLTATMRADGTSKFSKNNRWGNFPSIAVAWNIANERFMKKQSLFSNFKIRASYGIIGNQAIGAYETLGTLTKMPYAFGTETDYTGYYKSRDASPDLTWEKTKQLDLGTDISVWNGRVNISFDYFYKRTENALLVKSIPGYLGGGSFWVNSGEMENKGFEFSLNVIPIETNNFTWNSEINGTNVKNRVISLAGNPFIYGANALGGTANETTIVKPGHPLGAFFGYVWKGLDKNGNNVYEDKNNDGKVDGKDRDIIGYSEPTLTMGWNNSLTWKNWSMNLFFNGYFGAKRLNLMRFSMMSRTGTARFITLREAYFNNFDRTKSPSSEYPSLTSKDQTFQATSTQFLESADYIRLENISLSYLLPRKALKFAEVQLTLSAQNLFTITNYKGMDPASYSFGGNADINSGIDMGGYPTPRTFSFGMKFNF